MTEFSDELMLRYLEPANVHALLVPPTDLAGQRIRDLLASVYQPKLLTVEAVDEVRVTATRFQVPVLDRMTVKGKWERLTPSSEQALATVEMPGEICWLDMTLDVLVSVRVSSSLAPLASVGSEDVSELSQDDFLARFAFLDLPELMKVATVSTFEELQAEFPRLYKLHYADPPVFDPDDPAVTRTYQLRVSALFFPTLDLVQNLRQLTRSRKAVDAVTPRADGYEGGDLLAASAWLAIFPAGAAGAGPPTQDQITALLSADRFVAAFETV